MPFALAIIGASLVIVAVRGTQNELGTLLKNDFTGSGTTGGAPFLIWLVAILAVGGIGYSQTFRTPSRWLMALVIVSMVIANKGFFAQFQQQLGGAATQPSIQPTAQDQPPLPAGIPIMQVGGSSGSPAAGALGTATNVTKDIALLGAFA